MTNPARTADGPTGHGVRKKAFFSPRCMSTGAMAYELACDTCDFERSVDENWRAYGSARDHESEYPVHSVFVRRRE